MWADALTKVAAEKPTMESGTGGVGGGTGDSFCTGRAFDGESGDTFSQVESAGCYDGSVRAGIQTASAVAASFFRERGGVMIHWNIDDDFSQQDERSEPRRNEQ